MQDFISLQKSCMVEWRKTNISTIKTGTQSKDRKTGEPIYHSHIIPKSNWKETIWDGIRNELVKYIENPESKVQAHTGTHNLVSSWILAANLYFPIKKNDSLKKLSLSFLQQKVSTKITELVNIELEFAFPKGDMLHPANLLGEMDGGRGSGQTSPDVAFIVKTKDGKGLVLTECKYTEHSFYRCSARRTISKGEHEGNKYPERCMQIGTNCDYNSICHQTNWGRKYWSLLCLTEFGKKTLKRCPAATAGYQLFRQQALAEGIMKSGDYSLVASAVAFDERNTDLKGCLRTTGIIDFQTGWGAVFEGKSVFKTWTHQEWIQFVRDNQVNGEFDAWLEYLNKRYGY